LVKIRGFGGDQQESDLWQAIHLGILVEALLRAIRVIEENALSRALLSGPTAVS